MVAANHPREFKDLSLKSKIEAIISMNPKPISRGGVATCLDVSEWSPKFYEALDDLIEKRTVLDTKKGLVAASPLPPMAVVRVGGIKKYTGKDRDGNDYNKFDYQDVKISFENDTDFPFNLIIKPNHARKHNLKNGELILVTLDRHEGNQLRAQFRDRFTRTKCPKIGVKFTKAARSDLANVAEIQDDGFKKIIVPVDRTPAKPMKHGAWVAHVPKDFSFSDPTLVLDDERYDEKRGSRLIFILANKHGLSAKLPYTASEESRKLARRKPDYEGYRDLRDLPAFVIDPPNAFDRDDAIFIEEMPYTGGFRTLVLTADVVSRVRPSTMSFQYALERGPTHYFNHDRKAFHQLHPNLVRACSLYEGGPKKVEYVETFWDGDLNPLESHIGLGVIESHQAITYGQMDDLLYESDTVRAYSDFGDIAIDKQRGREDLVPYMDGNDNYALFPKALVNFLMTHANHQKALFAEEKELPFVYRVHGFCTNEFMYAQVYQDLQSRGYDLPSSYREITDSVLRNVIMQAQERDVRNRRASEEVAVDRIIKRLLERAKYSTSPGWHEGLKLEAFAHTTSPVRRTSDLICQAALHLEIHPQAHISNTALPSSIADNLDQHVKDLNRFEVTAESVESDYLHSHEYRVLAKNIGGFMRCSVSGVFEHEIEIMYPKNGIRTKVPIDELPKHFFDDEKRLLPLEANQPVQVKVTNVVPEKLQWDVSVERMVGRKRNPVNAPTRDFIIPEVA